jgi:Mg-chelatase subunit ChlD
VGYEDRWLDYDPKTSVDRVGRALAAIKPRGNTNMYAAFETAFRYRDRGLDTIYVLSDGLPNIGEGLTLEVAKSLKEFERSEILSKHVRKTLRTDWNRTIAGKARVRIHTIGFFYESPDVGAFLWALARENDGSFVGMSKP